MIQTQDNTFAYLLHDVTRLLRKHFDRRAAPLGLTRSQWRALKAIHRHPGVSQAELADLLDARRFTGRAADQVKAFLAREVAEALKGHQAAEAAEVRV